MIPTKMEVNRVHTEKAKELFMSDPNWQKHLRAQEFIECCDRIIELSTKDG